MKQFLAAFILTSLIVGTVYAQDTLKSGILWDQDKARTLALKHLEKEVDVTLFQGIDPQFLENMQLQKNPDANTKMAHRQVTFFSGGDYAVAYDGESIVNYYQSNGMLLKVSVCSTPFGEDLDYSNYPRKCVEYNYPQGKILSVSLDVAPDESYVFLPNGELKNHWLGNKGFSAQGQELWGRQ